MFGCIGHGYNPVSVQRPIGELVDHVFAKETGDVREEYGGKDHGEEQDNRRLGESHCFDTFTAPTCTFMVGTVLLRADSLLFVRVTFNLAPFLFWCRILCCPRLRRIVCY